MGSFFMTCSISHMTLNNQKTSIQLLVPGYSTDYSEHMSGICSNEGAQAFFSPFGFPIHGRYDDYGHLKDIQRDKNVELLEEFFGITINQIIENVGDGRSVPKETKNEELFRKLGMTYIRTEVLEFMERGYSDVNLINPRSYSGENYLKEFIDNAKTALKPERIKELLDKIRKKTATEEEEEEYFNKSSDYEIYSKSYVKSSTNFFRLLSIDYDAQLDDIKKQWTWIRRLGYDMNRILVPSDYGSQSENFAEIYELNEFVNDLLVEDIKDTYSEIEDELDEFINKNKADSIRRILKTHNRNKALNQLGL